MSRVAGSRRKPARVIRPIEPRDAETRIALRDVKWEVYDVLSDAIPEGSHVRVLYDGKDLEIMTPGHIHGYFVCVIGLIVYETAIAMEIPLQAAGRTTWKRPELARGLEADHSYDFTPEKLEADARALARKSIDIADYPNPDLAIEINISPPAVDREGIYKAMRVPEI